MRVIFLIGLHFVRTQWIPLAVVSAHIIGIGSVYRLHTQKEDVLFFLRLHAGYALSLAVMMVVSALQTERKSRRSGCLVQGDTSLGISERHSVWQRHHLSIFLH